MTRNVAQKLIAEHLVDGEMTPGAEIGIRIDQTLTQDATGTMVMLELEAMGLDRVRTRSCPRSTSTTTCSRPTSATPTTTCSSRAPAAVRPLVQQAGQRRQPPGAHAALRHRRARRCSAPTATPAPPGRSACSPSAPAVSRSRSAMAGEPFHFTMPRDLGRPAGRRAARLGERQGRDPRDAAATRRRRRLRQDHRVPRPRPRAAVGDGPARDREHGRRARRDHDRLPVRRRGAPLPRVRGSRGRLAWSCAPIPTPPTSTPKRSTSPPSSRSSPCPSSPGNVVPGPRGRRARRSTRCVIGSSANPGLRDFAVAGADRATAGRRTSASRSTSTRRRARPSRR